jgi:opacity protein-like surface antigen
MTMNKSTTIKTLILAAAVSLGLAVAARAADDNGTQVPVPATSAGRGLLGQNYANLGFSYHELKGAPVDAKSFNLDLNQAVSEGFDAQLAINELWSNKFAGGRLSQRIIDGGVRVYTMTRGFKPYVEAGAGWVWQKAPLGLRENSFAYYLGTGVEFQPTADLSVTPFVRFLDATKRSFDHEWDYGIKANYWLNDNVGLSAAVIRDNSRDMEYNLGLTIRY